MFYKPITSLQNPDDTIVIPKDSKNTHYEGELVLDRDARQPDFRR